MKKKINCFVPFGNPKDTIQTVRELQASELVNRIYLLSTGTNRECLPRCECLLVNDLYSTSTIKTIADDADDVGYLLLYTRQTPLKLELYVLGRMTQVIQSSSENTMAYADHYQLAGGVLKQAPVIDYQQESLRNDFDFSSVLLFNSGVFTLTSSILEETVFQYATFYEMRLILSNLFQITHINEFLYTEVETDTRKNGEKQFDYVNPKNQGVQTEVERVYIKHLKGINAYVRPSSRTVNLDREALEFEASVIVPVRNHVRTIRNAVNSALSQRTAFPFNVIAIDNHSADGTTEALQEFSADSKLMHVIPQGNDLGIGGCWDVGVHHEKCGKFAVQPDSSDLYKDEHTLQKIIDTFYQQNCTMVMGTCLVTDFQMDEIAPDVIDHKEWTVEDGPDNALRINGLSAPRTSYTPILRRIRFPSTSYGEDYAIGLGISREYTIGRIHDVIYLCRRWEGSSDTASNIEKINRSSFYKDGIRTWELQTRIQVHSVDESFQRLVNGVIKKQREDWKLAKKDYRELEQNLEKEKTLGLKLGGDTKRVRLFPDPQRAVSTMAQTDSQLIQERLCFLCSNSRPAEQTFLSLGHYEVCLNPYPTFHRRLTIIEKGHTPQTIKSRFENISFLAENMNEFLILYNGPKYGVSTPDHMYFQAAGREEEIANSFRMTFISDMFSSENGVHSHLEGGFTTSIGISSPNRRGITEMFECPYDEIISIYHDEEPLTSVIAWYGLETVNRTGGDEIKQWSCIIFLRSKHQPERYCAQGKKGLLISLAIVGMCSIFPIVREKDLDEITAKKITQIYKEISLSQEQLKVLTDQTSQ